MAAKFRLWTPIANSLEAYRRRLIADETALYEHIWRLIHIEEALIVTLGAALCTRLMENWNEVPERHAELNELRSIVVGIVPPESDSSSIDKWCLDGRIDAWVDLLQKYATEEKAYGCPFCGSVANYLTEELDGEIAFVPSWQKIATVPPTIYGVRTSNRVQRIRALNQFRNKLAHVPISHKILSGLHKGIRIEVLKLLSHDSTVLKERETSDITTFKWHAPLIGRLRNNSGFVSGSEYGQLASPETADSGKCNTWFEWNSSGDESLLWKADPFVKVDEELKVVLLFRLDGVNDVPSQDEFTGEYHRFAAEVEPVQKKPVLSGEIERWIPTTIAVEADEESAKDSATDQTGDPTHIEQLADLTPRQLRNRAEDSFRDRNYADSYKYWDELSNRGDLLLYNDVAKMKHGSTAREIAQDTTLSIRERLNYVKKAIELLERAKHHSDYRYQARAIYLESKAYWTLWGINDNPEHFQMSMELAKNAATISYDSSYVSWYERLEREADSQDL